MMNDNDVASKFKATIRILFVFAQIIVFGQIVKTPMWYSPSWGPFSGHICDN